MRVVFLGSPPFARPLFAALARGERHACVALVTKPDRPRGRGLHVEESPLVALARARGIPVLQPEHARGAEFLAALRELAPDALLVASYGEILRQDVLDLPRLGCFNVHASLLPRHRGAAPVQAAILAGDAETGVSVQRMVLALDQGDVVAEERTAIGTRENAGELLERLAHLGAGLALRALDAIEAGTATFRPQDPARATYARRIRKEDGVVDWTLAADALDRLVRALTPWPGARTQAPDGKEIALLEVEPEPDSRHSASPGCLLDAASTLRIACGRGAIAVRSVKPAGKGAMDGAAWLRGSRLAPGARFGAHPGPGASA